MHLLQKKSKSIIDQFRGTARQILEKVLIDQTHFPVQSQRFTAVYSRDKEYL